MNEKIDKLLFEALQPNLLPEDDVNKALIDRYEHRRDNEMFRFKGVKFAAVLAVCVLSIGTLTVVAANYFLKASYVSKYGISNRPDMRMEERDDTQIIEETIISEEKGNKDTKWLSRRESMIDKFVIITYEFSDYEDALAESGQKNWLSKEFKQKGNAFFQTGKYSSYIMKSASATFYFGQGSFDICQDIDVDKEGNYKSDSSFLLVTGENYNERTYINSSGEKFTLADSICVNGTEVTNVLISYEGHSGCLRFSSMTEDEIHEVLDCLVFE